jgi:diketogulonate reductase-like aldo/keto reductase
MKMRKQVQHKTVDLEAFAPAKRTVTKPSQFRLSQPTIYLLLVGAILICAVSLFGSSATLEEGDDDEQSINKAFFNLRTGDQIPAIGLGTWRAAEGDVGKAVRYALEEKLYDLVDCSPRYLNEREIGSDAIAPVLKTTIHEDGTTTKIRVREHLFIVSKLWNSNHAPDRVRPALMRTLHDLNVTYLDMWLMHWPVALKKKDTARCAEYDGWECDDGCCDDTTIAETWKIMEDLHLEGFVLSIGVSNFDTHKLEALMATARVKPAANQVSQCTPSARCVFSLKKYPLQWRIVSPYASTSCPS